MQMQIQRPSRAPVVGAVLVGIVSTVLVVLPPSVPRAAAAAPTATSVALAVTPSSYVQAASTYTLTATVSPSSAAGTVTFSASDSFDPTTHLFPLGTAPVASGVAMLLTSLPPGGAPTGLHLRASFAPADAAAYAPSVSPFVDHRVVATPTTLTLAPTPAGQVTAGQPLTLRANIAAVDDLSHPVSIDRGAVDFFDGSASLGPVVTVLGGTATYVSTALTTGVHTLSARYRDVATSTGIRFASTGFVTTTYTVVPSSSLTLAPTGCPAHVGDRVILTATVAPVGLAGTVQFAVDGPVAGAAVAVVGSTATMSVTLATPGSHQLGATFVPTDPKAAGGSTATVNCAVLSGPTDTTTALTAAPAAGTAYGQQVTFAVTVTPPTAVGTVQLRDGAGPLGPVLPVVNGAATWSTTTLAVGSHPLSAAFVPADPTRYAASTSAAVPYPVGSAPNSVTLTATPPGPFGYGTAVTLRATVGQTAAQGTVVFFDAMATLGSAPVASAVALLTVPMLPAGGHQLSARFVPAPGSPYAGADAPFVPVTVIPAVTTTSVTVVPPLSVIGQAVTATARVVGSVEGGAPVQGTVSFVDGPVTLGSGVVAADGTASLTTAALALGPHPLVAQYLPLPGGSYVSSSSAPTTLTVSATPTTTTLTLGPATVTAYGTPLVLTASVAPSAAAGTVTFTDAGTVLGTAVLSSGAATYTLQGLLPGSHALTAAFTPQPATPYLGSTSTPVATTVTTSTALAVTPAGGSSWGSPVTLTATVAPSSSTGTVTFRADGASLGTAVPAGGTATLPAVTTLAVGAHTLTATFTPTTLASLASTSPPLAYTVAKRPSQTALTVSPALTVAAGSLVALAASVTPADLAGTVQFRDGTAALGDPVAVQAGSAVLTAPALAVGPHPLTAVFTPSDPAHVAGSTSASSTLSVTTVAAGCAGAGSSPFPCVVTRMSNGSAGVGDSRGVLQVQVGTRTYRQDWSKAAPSDCPVGLWFVVLDRHTLNPIWQSQPGNGGLAVSPCTGGSVDAAVAQIVARVDPADPVGSAPIVIVNTLSTKGDCGSYVDPSLGTRLKPLGFQDPAGLGGLDWCAASLTGLGSPALATPDTGGQAWQKGWQAAADAYTGTGGAYAPTTGAVTGYLVPTADAPGLTTGPYHFVNLDAKVARRYGGDGPGGWEVDGVRYSSDNYPGGTVTPPAGRGGFQLVSVVNQSSAGPLSATGFTYWTNTGISGNDAQAWSALVHAVRSGLRRDGFLLLRNVGSGKGAVTTSTTDPALAFADLLDQLGGVYDAVTRSGTGDDLSIVIPGGTPLGLTPAQRQRSGYPRVTTVGDVMGKARDPRQAYVLLARQPVGFWYQPAQVRAASTPDDPHAEVDADQRPFAFQALLAQPSTPWPFTGPGDSVATRTAFADWSGLLCGCSDARAKFLDQQTTGWWEAFQDHLAAVPAGATYSLAVWQSVGRELAQELVWAQNVGRMEGTVLAFHDRLTAGSGAALVSAFTTVSDSLKQDAEIDLSRLGTAHVGQGVVNLLLLLAWLLPGPLGKVFGLAAAAWFGALEYMNSKTDAPDPRLSTSAATLGQDALAVIAQNRHGVGVEFALVLGDYGRLRAAGRAVGSGDPVWTQAPTGADVLAATRAAEAGFYQALLPAVYEEIHLRDAGPELTTALQHTSQGFDSYAGHPSSWQTTPGPAGGTDWVLVGKRPLFVDESSKPEPLSEQLARDIQSLGLWWPEVLRTWPLPRMNCPDALYGLPVEGTGYQRDISDCERSYPPS